jgi:lipoprotein-anchoring transpeptidase ErfK/SrfK
VKTKRWLIAIAAAAYMGFIVLVGAAHYSGLRQVSGWAPGHSGPSATETDIPKVRRDIQQVQRRMDALRPKGVHIVIDTADNKLHLKIGEDIIRTAVVSCGSGVILEAPGGKNRTWVFDTPRGEFTVKSKIRNPYWVKPDWAFIEEGEPIPKRPDDRIEAGTLGDYALGFGDGYFIHGTLYTRLLGRNVTHGCVRVGDEDLEEVFKAVPLGAKIYIY